MYEPKIILILNAVTNSAGFLQTSGREQSTTIVVRISIENTLRTNLALFAPLDLLNIILNNIQK